MDDQVLQSNQPTDRRPIEVSTDSVPSWPGISAGGRVVARFLALVRTTGDPDAAREVLEPSVRAHQVVAEAPETVIRTPEEYAAHVRDMLETFGPFRLLVEEVLDLDERVYVRWRQHGKHMRTRAGAPGTGRPVTEVGSAVFRIRDDRIVEYWIQLDRQGLATQLAELEASS